MTNHEEMEEQLIETVDEEGNIINFELIDIIDMDGQEYGLLLPKEENDDPEEEKEEFNKVVDYIDSLEETEEDAQ